KMGVSISIETKREKQRIVFQINANKAGMLIGKRGNTLNALQYLTNLAANRQSDEKLYIVLDTENYREKREETLKQLAYRLSEKANKLGREVRLDPMPSMERKIIHIS